MSPGASANVPVAAFCDTEQEIWGVLVGGSDPLLVLARVAGARAGELLPAQAMLDPDAAVWQVQSAGAALSFSAEPGSSGTLIRCGVTGTCTVGDEQLELAARGVRHPGTDGRAASLRLVTAWFAAGHGAALIARRPPNSSGQDRDVVSVDVFGEAEHVQVFDPRLSTTYGPGTWPQRMGFELWLGETEDGDHYPRRVAGERVGSVVESATGLGVTACAMKCQSRGDDGLGVYLLVSAS
jgi:hypothetical protein